MVVRGPRATIAALPLGMMLPLRPASTQVSADPTSPPLGSSDVLFGIGPGLGPEGIDEVPMLDVSAASPDRTMAVLLDEQRPHFFYENQRSRRLTYPVRPTCIAVTATPPRSMPGVSPLLNTSFALPSHYERTASCRTE